MIRTRYLLLLALAAYLLTGLSQVRPEERAVVRRFGRVVAHPGPGLWVGLPWGVDRVDRVPVRTVRQLRAGYNREVEAAAAEWAGGRPVDEVLLTGNAALPAWLMARLPDRLAPLRLGVRVQR